MEKIIKSDVFFYSFIMVFGSILLYGIKLEGYDYLNIMLILVYVTPFLLMSINQFIKKRFSKNER